MIILRGDGEGDVSGGRTKEACPPGPRDRTGEDDLLGGDAPEAVGAGSLLSIRVSTSRWIRDDGVFNLDGGRSKKVYIREGFRPNPKTSSLQTITSSIFFST